MNDARIEPTIDHEFVVTLARETEPDSKRALLALRVRTVREFTSFGYEIGLTNRSAPSKNEYGVEIGGLSVPRVSTPVAGGARSSISLVMPVDGTYDLVIHKRNRQGRARFTITGGIPTQIDDAGGDPFVRFEIDAA
ncbi:MAG TPA: hypothetical protein VK147_12625 [Candidatus Didemnitutus sp.]|nr:hypothetical protein [Candidatus Didemnitutus sp.]